MRKLGCVQSNKYKTKAFISTYNGVTPELRHFTDPHRGQQGLPDVQFKHVANHYLHGCSNRSAVIYHRALVVTQLRAEVEGHLDK